MPVGIPNQCSSLSLVYTAGWVRILRGEGWVGVKDHANFHSSFEAAEKKTEEMSLKNKSNKTNSTCIETYTLEAFSVF